MRRLYHFLKAQYAVAAIKKRCLRVSRIEDLNDAFEFIGIALDDKRDRIHLSSYRRRLDLEQGIICMSETWSKPQMWGHYGESFRGMVLGFDVSEADFFKVRYRKTRPRLADLGLSSYAEIGLEHLKELARIKSDGWAYEDEWRWLLPLVCQSARKVDPGSASKIDPHAVHDGERPTGWSWSGLRSPVGRVGQASRL